MSGEVTVLPLVERQEPVEVGGRAHRRGGSLSESGDSRGVITPRLDGAFANIDLFCQDHVVPNPTGLLEIGIGDVTARVIPAHQTVDDISRERVPPDHVA